ncbi:hypothetical protein B7486_16585 [cyanobacterium TDX16]|nr:hypothetical protein B7486_16585 [cyanobacterium TDX16]
MPYGGPLGRHKIAKKLAEDGWVRLATSRWLDGACTPASMKGAIRHLRGLVIDGLIELAAIDGGSRTSHVRLTPRGEKAAREELAALEAKR